MFLSGLQPGPALLKSLVLCQELEINLIFCYFPIEQAAWSLIKEAEKHSEAE
jgi:hypothetical protein